MSEQMSAEEFGLNLAKLLEGKAHPERAAWISSEAKLLRELQLLQEARMQRESLRDSLAEIQRGEGK